MFNGNGPRYLWTRPPWNAPAAPSHWAWTFYCKIVPEPRKWTIVWCIYWQSAHNQSQWSACKCYITSSFTLMHVTAPQILCNRLTSSWVISLFYARTVEFTSRIVRLSLVNCRSIREAECKYIRRASDLVAYSFNICDLCVKIKLLRYSSRTKISVVTSHSDSLVCREKGAVLFQDICVFLQRFNSVLLHDSFLSVHCPNWWPFQSLFLQLRWRWGDANFMKASLFISHPSWDIASYTPNCSRSFFDVFCGWTIHPTVKVSEEVNRKLPVRNTTVQLLTLYNDPQRHNAQRYRRTDGRTDGVNMMPIVYHAV